ncbi:MFS transporter [Streptantibioticus silvisoli]|nr:MFS transporter [Streptantibioticus silvisoli]
MVLCVNLRPAVAGLPPIFTQLQDRLALSSVDVTLLATIPVLCFGLFSPVAALTARRFGEERALGGALVAGAAGLLMRALLPGALLLAGTVVVSGAIAFMNVSLPSLIKRREPRRAGRLLSLYMVMLYTGAITSSAIVVPVYRSTHGSLAVTLGMSAVPMVVALLAWLPQLRYGTARRAASLPPGASQRLPRGHVRRHRLAWQVTAFMGLQSMTYYATLSFLPDLFLSRGLAPSQSGLVGSLLSVGGLVSAFGTPMIAHRSARAARLLMIATVVLCAAGISAALLAPVNAGLALMPLLGLGQGAGLALALYFVMARAATPAVAASLSALAQGVGYVVAALGPLAVGSLHALTGGWRAPVLVLLLATAAELVVGLLAARPHQVPAPGPAARYVPGEDGGRPTP